MWQGGKIIWEVPCLYKVEICGVDTAKLPTLDPKEMHELLVRIKKGDEDARQRFIKANLRLVLSVVQRFVGRGESPDDLCQVGCIGLLKAIQNFDLSHEVRFSTYAVPMIIGEMRRHLRDYTAVRVSRSLRDTAYKVMQTKNRLSSILDHEPTLGEIAAELKLPEEELVFALDAISEPVSLYEPVFHDDGDAVSIIDQLRDERVSEGKWLDALALREGIKALKPREQRILELRYYRCKTQMEVSREIGISQAQVSRLEKNALKQLKRYV